MTRAEERPQELLDRLKKYAVAATAVGAAGVMLSEKSEAAIIVFDSPEVGLGGASFSFDATSADKGAGLAAPYDIQLFGTFGFAAVNTSGNADVTTTLVPAGTVIGAGTTFTGLGTPQTFNPAGVSNVLFGFSVMGEPSLPGTIYGWAEISVPAGTNDITLHRWAYENTGASIQAGATMAAAAVPEPSSLAACATLAMAGGLASVRRRRKQKAAEAAESVA